ncbi:hypothetical protein PGTUg99_006306 [Puccinia graminis f. sp. tritici]|uniref:No apical meristem-associated C-terminal domain-containing protein n=1 Tax=Puccinia graminis f. sp. tritici TaxID=56615 RepID=A0A5B0QGE0_PUCGR|nr:hypothetical protein PGTUg99_006306 [Puccinia graminis f. sp. tritici]
MRNSHHQKLAKPNLIGNSPLYKNSTPTATSSFSFPHTLIHKTHVKNRETSVVVALRTTPAHSLQSSGVVYPFEPPKNYKQEIDLKAKKSKQPSSTPTTTTDDTAQLSSQADTQPDEEDEPSNRSALGSESRPEGNKAAKRKRDEDAMLEKIIRTQEELVKISKERSASVQKAMQEASAAKQSEADDRIMAMDISGLDEEAKAYWQKKRRAILDRS